MSIKNLFYWSYWFQQPYIARDRVLLLWLAVFFFLILVGFISLVMRHVKKNTSFERVWSRVSRAMLTLGFLGILWFFFRQERVIFLAWRFWLLIWFGVGVIWVTKIISYAARRLPQIALEQAARVERERYLPGKK